MSQDAKLLAIVSVSRAARVQCQNPGCGHGVYAAIHVVEDGGQLLVLGSTCFVKRYGNTHVLGKPHYFAGGGNGVCLSEEERQMLKDNTAALMAIFKTRHEHTMNAAKEKLKALGYRLSHGQHGPNHSVPAQAAIIRRPWTWQHPRNTSVAVFGPVEGQSWVRVQHSDGSQKLVPWPMFEGWDEALPSACGLPDRELQAYAVSDLPKAFALLKQFGHTGPTIGVWPDVFSLVRT